MVAAGMFVAAPSCVWLGGLPQSGRYAIDLIERRRRIDCGQLPRRHNGLQERALDVSNKGWSIRHRLMLLALAVALPFVLLTGGIVWQLANNERENRREAILFSTRTLMNAVDTILSKQIAVAQMLATSPALQADDLRDIPPGGQPRDAGPVRRLDRAERTRPGNSSSTSLPAPRSRCRAGPRPA